MASGQPSRLLASLTRHWRHAHRDNAEGSGAPFELLPDERFEAGQEVSGPLGATVRYQGIRQFRSLDVSPIIEFATDIRSKVIAAWIIDKFKGRTKKVGPGAPDRPGQDPHSLDLASRTSPDRRRGGADD